MGPNGAAWFGLEGCGGQGLRERDYFHLSYVMRVVGHLQGTTSRIWCWFHSLGSLALHLQQNRHHARRSKHGCGLRRCPTRLRGDKSPNLATCQLQLLVLCRLQELLLHTHQHAGPALRCQSLVLARGNAV